MPVLSTRVCMYLYVCVDRIVGVCKGGQLRGTFVSRCKVDDMAVISVRWLCAGIYMDCGIGRARERESSAEDSRASVASAAENRGC